MFNMTSHSHSVLQSLGSCWICPRRCCWWKMLEVCSLRLLPTISLQVQLGEITFRLASLAAIFSWCARGFAAGPLSGFAFFFGGSAASPSTSHSLLQTRKLIQDLGRCNSVDIIDEDALWRTRLLRICRHEMPTIDELESNPPAQGSPFSVTLPTVFVYDCMSDEWWKVNFTGIVKHVWEVLQSTLYHECQQPSSLVEASNCQSIPMQQCCKHCLKVQQTHAKRLCETHTSMPHQTPCYVCKHLTPVNHDPYSLIITVKRASSKLMASVMTLSQTYDLVWQELKTHLGVGLLQPQQLSWPPSYLF